MKYSDFASWRENKKIVFEKTWGESKKVATALQNIGSLSVVIWVIFVCCQMLYLQDTFHSSNMIHSASVKIYASKWNQLKQATFGQSDENVSGTKRPQNVFRRPLQLGSFTGYQSRPELDRLHSDIDPVKQQYQTFG